MTKGYDGNYSRGSYYMIITKSNQQWNSTKLNGRHINEIIEEWELKIKKRNKCDIRKVMSWSMKT